MRGIPLRLIRLLTKKLILEATHTHLYPGHRGRISGLAQIADLQSGRDCIVEFSDGSVATGRISRCGSDWHLHTAAYGTAAGTDIAARLWLVGLSEERGQVEFRIRAKAQKD